MTATPCKEGFSKLGQVKCLETSRAVYLRDWDPSIGFFGWFKAASEYFGWGLFALKVLGNAIDLAGACPGRGDLGDGKLSKRPTSMTLKPL